MADRTSLARELGALGVAQGDVLMVHASLKALGPVEGGPAAVVGALMDAVGPGDTIMDYVSWDRSPYGETLNGARMDDAERRGWPAFDPATAGVYPGFGLLNRFIAETAGARRSAHPDASMVALGARARELVAPHRLGQAFGPGSPVERFIRMGGRVLMLGAPLDSVTALHYAEAVADIPGKRRVSYEMPLRGPEGETVWQACEDFDSNGVLDCFAAEGQPDVPDAVETLPVPMSPLAGTARAWWARHAVSCSTPATSWPSGSAGLRRGSASAGRKPLPETRCAPCA